METQKEKVKAEFDEVGGRYDDLVTGALSIENSHEYFESYKVMHLKKVMKKVGCQGSKFRVLDYGCGVGLLSKQIMREFDNVSIDGFDVSAESIAYVPEELQEGGNMFTTDLEDLSSDYDMAILSVVLHHVDLDERAVVIRNIHDHLRMGGVLVIIEHNLKNLLTKKTVDSCDFDKAAIMLNKEEAESLMWNVGFQNIRSRYIIFFPEQLRCLRKLDGVLGWVPLGAQFMTVGYK